MAPQARLERARPFGRRVNSALQYHYAYCGIIVVEIPGNDPDYKPYESLLIPDLPLYLVAGPRFELGSPAYETGEFPLL
jgi:hypothetical protein